MVESLEVKLVDGNLETDRESFTGLLNADLGALLESYQPEEGEVINNIEYDPLSAEILGTLDPDILKVLFFVAYGLKNEEIAEKIGETVSRVTRFISLIYDRLFDKSEEYDNRSNAAVLFWHAFPQLFPREGIERTPVQLRNFRIIGMLSNAKSGKAIVVELESANEKSVVNYISNAVKEIADYLPLSAHPKISAGLYFKLGVLYTYDK